MRGKACNIHPAKVLGKKSSVCGRTDSAVAVEDHGNGFMFSGTGDIDQAKRIIAEYVDNPEDYRIATPLLYNGLCSIWLTDTHGALWDGAEGRYGYPRAAK